MALPSSNLSNTDIVAGQKIYASTELARIALINAFIAACVDQCVLNTGNQTIAGVKTFSSLPKVPEDDPTADTEVVSKAYLDSVIANLGFHTANVTIKNNTSVGDTDWHEYDLSATIGAAKNFCIFSIVTDADYSFGVREDGTTFNFTNPASGASIFDPGAANQGGTICCLSSTAGKIEYKSINAGMVVTLKLIGYFKNND
jgi:hypothetical protein